MIVYYDPDTFEIKGMSGILVEGRAEPYFETDDPLALQIFLGKEKSIKYIAVVRPGEKKGVIKSKPSKYSTEVLVNDRVHKVSNNRSLAEVKILQNTDDKTIEVIMSEDYKQWWMHDPTYGKRRLHIVACVNDPYTPLWIKSIKHDEIEKSFKFEYHGRDDFVIYTSKIFESYSHEVTSSRN